MGKNTKGMSWAVPRVHLTLASDKPISLCGVLNPPRSIVRTEWTLHERSDICGTCRVRELAARAKAATETKPCGH